MSNRRGVVEKARRWRWTLLHNLTLAFILDIDSARVPQLQRVVLEVTQICLAGWSRLLEKADLFGREGSSEGGTVTRKPAIAGLNHCLSLAPRAANDLGQWAIASTRTAWWENKT